MIRRYLSTETVYEHNKYVLSPLKADVIEEANGMFELEIDLKRGVEINKRDIISAPTPRGEQPFRIYRVVRTLKGIRAYARHIFYDLMDYLVISMTGPDKTPGYFLSRIIQNISFAGWVGWTSSSDVLTPYTASYVRRNPVDIIMGLDDSLLQKWGGNLVRDKKDIKILSSGIDKGFEIRLGNNLIGIEGDSDDDNVVTRLYPTYEKDGFVYGVVAPYPVYIDSPFVGDYPHPKSREVRVPLTDEEKQLTNVEIKDLLYAYCNKMFTVNQVDRPGVNYKIDFVTLSKIATIPQENKYTVGGLEQLTYSTIETLTYADLEGTNVIEQFIDLMGELDLYDTITVNVKDLDIDVQAMVIKYRYDAIAERYREIEVGNFKSFEKYATENIVKQIRTNELNRVKLV